MMTNIIAFLLALSEYSAIHLVPTFMDFSFPLGAELMLWNISCYTIIASLAGAPLALLCFLSIIKNWFARRFAVIREHKSLRNSLDSILGIIAAMYPAFLLFARLYTMVESYPALLKERAEIFLTPEWNWLALLPHV